jgi:beta-galactosidase/beta-glucuronidase
MPDAKFWSPTSPELYHLLAELVAPDQGLFKVSEEKKLATDLHR